MLRKIYAVGILTMFATMPVFAESAKDKLVSTISQKCPGMAGDAKKCEDLACVKNLKTKCDTSSGGGNATGDVKKQADDAGKKAKDKMKGVLGN